MQPDRVLLSRETLAAVIGDRWSTSEVAAAADLLAESNGQFVPTARLRELPSDLIKAVQRERMLAGMLRATSEVGYHDVSVQDVLERAGISRPTFYEQFDNKEDCFLAAIDAAAQRLRERVEAAAAGGGESWRDRLRMGVEELLRFIAAEPDAARALIVEARGAGPVGVLRYDDLLEHFSSCIDAQIREELPDASSSISAEGIVGGIAMLLHTRLSKGELDDLESLLPSLMYFAVLPYGGHEAATEELSGTPASG